MPPEFHTSVGVDGDRNLGGAQRCAIDGKLVFSNSGGLCKHESIARKPRGNGKEKNRSQSQYWKIGRLVPVVAGLHEEGRRWLWQIGDLDSMGCVIIIIVRNLEKLIIGHSDSDE